MIVCTDDSDGWRVEVDGVIIWRGLSEDCAIVVAMLERTKYIYRSIHSEECKMLPLGGGCKCFLCQIDSFILGVIKAADND